MKNWKQQYEIAHAEHGEMIDRFDALYMILKEHGIESDTVNQKFDKRTESVQVWFRQAKNNDLFSYDIQSEEA
jgi:hypothetical protein